ncbi:helix-turn-helix domain-containing protein, partial [Moraxella nonliquefaciens]|uniref:helix-turn-helix domain-containing protein n=1 Tax=Moraxella nonliquefaciens TaxID=478 RepID=UPI003D0CBEE6
MQKYTHLTLEQRYQISSDLKSNISISEIARRLGCHKSIICQEIKRNTGLRG